MNEKITGYINSVIPSDIPQKKKKSLADELACHIEDKADFYREIGYDEDASVEKAVADMGADEKIKEYLSHEFEELYHERTSWAVGAAAFILLMNLMCIPLNTWYYSVKINTPGGYWIAVSFIMTFAVLALIRFAKVRRYRKMLIGIGIANLLIGLSSILSFYPQGVFSAMETDFYYLVDKLTPFVLSDYDFENYFFLLLLPFLVIVAACCFILSVKIKKNRIKAEKNAKRTSIILACVYAVFAVFVTALYPVANNFRINYPRWFEHSNYYAYSEDTFNGMDINSTADEAREYLTSQGYVSVEDYEKTLTKNMLKKFRAEYNSLNIDPKYTVWFDPNAKNWQKSFIYTYSADGKKLSEIGVGEPDLITAADEEFILISDNEYDLDKMNEELNALSAGDSRSEVMSVFGSEYGEINLHFTSTDGENITDRYVLCASNYEIPKTEFVELTFTNNKLAKIKAWYYSYEKKITVEPSMPDLE